MLLNVAAIMVWGERKVCALIQQRPGPNRVGPYGLLQPLADIIKLIMKEELRPKAADSILFYAAPILSAKPLTASSRMLANFVSPYDATATVRLKAAGAVRSLLSSVSVSKSSSAPPPPRARPIACARSRWP